MRQQAERRVHTTESIQRLENPNGVPGSAGDAHAAELLAEGRLSKVVHVYAFGVILRALCVPHCLSTA